MPLWLCNTDFKQFLACGNHRAQTRNLPAVFFVPLKICPRDSRRFALQDSFLSNWSTCTSRFRNEGRIYKRKKLNTDTKIKNQHIAYVLTPYCDLCTIQCDVLLHDLHWFLYVFYSYKKTYFVLNLKRQIALALTVDGDLHCPDIGVRDVIRSDAFIRSRLLFGDGFQLHVFSLCHEFMNSWGEGKAQGKKCIMKS